MSLTNVFHKYKDHVIKLNEELKKAVEDVKTVSEALQQSLPEQLKLIVSLPKESLLIHSVETLNELIEEAKKQNTSVLTISNNRGERWAGNFDPRFVYVSRDWRYRRPTPYPCNWCHLFLGINGVYTYWVIDKTGWTSFTKFYIDFFTPVWIALSGVTWSSRIALIKVILSDGSEVPILIGEGGGWKAVDWKIYKVKRVMIETFGQDQAMVNFVFLKREED